MAQTGPSAEDEVWPGCEDFEMLKFFPKGKNAGGMNHGIAIMRQNSDNLLVVRKHAIEPKEDHTSARESHILKLLKGHANINEYVTAFRQKDYPEEGVNTTYIIVKLCDKGTLEDLIKRAREEKLEDGSPYCLPEEFLWHCFRSILNALLWLHWHIDLERGYEEIRKNGYILHRDIKAGNVFIGTEESHPYPRISLGDFGSAVQYGELMRQPPGRLRGVGVSTFFPPESPRFGRAGDVWGLGCTMLELMSHLRGGAFKKVEAIDSTKSGNEAIILANDKVLIAPRPVQEWVSNCDWYSSELKECVEQCLREDFPTRPSILRINTRVTERFDKLVEEQRLAEPPECLPESVDKDPDFFQPA